MSGDNRRRIVFVNHWARALGGAEYSLIDILKKIDNAAEVCLLTTETGPLVEQLKEAGVRQVVIPCPPGLLWVKRDNLAATLVRQWRAMAGFAIYILRVAAYVRRFQPDCIHANVPKSHMTLLIIMLLGFRGVGIIHMREIFPRQSVAFYLYRVLSRFRRLRVIAISEAVKNGLPPGMKRRATVLYNGVKIPAYNGDRIVNLPIRFLYLGRMVPWKGCHLLIEAFSALEKKVAQGSATLRLVGATSYWDTGYRKNLQDLVEFHKVGSWVTIEGMTEEPYSVLSCHHVLCVPSTREPFGRVAVEAQGNGLPVIGFADGGLSEIIVDGETGLLVPVGDRKGFTAAMAYFVNNPRSIAEFGKKGHMRAERYFNREVQVPAIISYIMAKIE